MAPIPEPTSIKNRVQSAGCRQTEAEIEKADSCFPELTPSPLVKQGGMSLNSAPFVRSGTERYPHPQDFAAVAAPLRYLHRCPQTCFWFTAPVPIEQAESISRKLVERGAAACVKNTRRLLDLYLAGNPKPAKRYCCLSKVAALGIQKLKENHCIIAPFMNFLKSSLSL